VPALPSLADSRFAAFKGTYHVDGMAALIPITLTNDERAIIEGRSRLAGAQTQSSKTATGNVRRNLTREFDVIELILVFSLSSQRPQRGPFGSRGLAPTHRCPAMAPKISSHHV
jgi:hypothetical protein